MNEEAQLKYYGGYSRFELQTMTSVERNWIINWIAEQEKKKSEAANSSNI